MQPNVIEIESVEGVVYEEVIGLCLTRSKGVSKELARAEWELSIRRHMMEQGLTDEQMETSPFLTITLDCGKKVIYQTFQDIPNEDVPCPCGNPKHWLLKFKEIE